MQVNLVTAAAFLSLLLSMGAVIGTAYVVRYRVERLEKDFTILIAQLQLNASLTAELTTAMKVFATRGDDIDDHEDRIRELERARSN